MLKMFKPFSLLSKNQRILCGLSIESYQSGQLIDAAAKLMITSSAQVCPVCGRLIESYQSGQLIDAAAKLMII